MAVTRSSPNFREIDMYVALLGLRDDGLAPYFRDRPHYHVFDPSVLSHATLEKGVIFASEAEKDAFLDRTDLRWHLTDIKWAAAHWPPVQWRVESEGQGRFALRWSEVATSLPKPSWTDVLDAWRKRRLGWFLGTARVPPGSARERPLVEYVGDAQRAVSEAPISHKRTGVAVRAAEGMEHLSALIHQLHRGTHAGEVASPSVLTDADDKPVTLWLEPDMSALLDDMAKATSAASSARNVLADRLQGILAVAEDPNGGLDTSATESDKLEARFAALKRAVEFVQSGKLDAAMQEEMKKLQKPLLPKETGAAKNVLKGRLEAAAMARQKALKGALTQQAIDNWAACVDQDSALSEIAKECTLGTLAIGRAEDDVWKRSGGAWAKLADADPVPGTIQHEGDDPPDTATGADGEFYRQRTGIAEAQAAFDAAAAKIRAVEVANVPEWKANGAAAAGTVKIAGRKLTVRASNPAGGLVVGPATINTWSVKYAPGTRTPPVVRSRFVKPDDDTEAHQLQIEVVGDARFPMTLDFNAHNLCGPSRLTVELTG